MFTSGLTVSYSQFFYEETPSGFDDFSTGKKKELLFEKLKEYMTGIGKKDLILKCIGLLNFDQKTSKYLTPEVFVNFWFNFGSVFYAKMICERLKWLSQKMESTVLPFNATTSLSLLEYILKNIKEEVTVKNKIDLEIDLFKAYTIQTELLNLEEANIDEHISNQDSKYIQQLFIRSFGYNDYINYDINTVYVSQIVKARLFLEYLETDEKFSKRLSLFLEKNIIENSKTYLDALFKLCKLVYNKETATDDTIRESPISLEPRGNEIDKVTSFLKTLSIDTEENSLQEDFKAIRNFPLYEESHNKFIVIFPLFLMEKAFKSFYWNIIKFNEKESGIKNPKSDIGLQFSENYITANVLNKVFESNEYKTMPGYEIRGPEKKSKGEPDYFAIKENKIFLFESKDASVDAGYKTGEKRKLNYDEIENELKKKFYETEDHKPKAIKQLVTNCIKILKKPDDCFYKDYDETKVLIYPILIVHDSSFTALGFNKILDGWFQEHLNFELSINNFSTNPQRVFQLVVIDIDTLIRFQEYFKKGMIEMNDVLYKYHLFCIHVPSTKEGVMQSASSFSKFLHEYVTNTFSPLVPEGFEIN